MLKVYAQCIEPYGNIYSDAYQNLSSILYVITLNSTSFSITVLSERKNNKNMLKFLNSMTIINLVFAPLLTLLGQSYCTAGTIAQY